MFLDTLRSEIRRVKLHAKRLRKSVCRGFKYFRNNILDTKTFILTGVCECASMGAHSTLQPIGGITEHSKTLDNNSALLAAIVFGGYLNPPTRTMFVETLAQAQQTCEGFWINNIWETTDGIGMSGAMVCGGSAYIWEATMGCNDNGICYITVAYYQL